MKDPADSNLDQHQPILSFLEFDENNPDAKAADDSEAGKAEAKAAAREKKCQILTDAYLTSRGLHNMQDYAEQTRAIARELVGATQMKSAKKGDKKQAQKAAERANLKAVVEQNWLLIQQNDTLIATLRQLDQDLRTATRYIAGKIDSPDK